MSFKRIVIFFILFTFCLSNINLVSADDIDDELDISFIHQDIEDVLSENINEPNIISRSAVIFDRDSKEIIWGKNESLRVPMASTTKIMTAIILLERNRDLNETIKVDKEAAAIGGSRLGLNTNDKITLNDLLYGLMICSR